MKIKMTKLFQLVKEHLKRADNLVLFTFYYRKIFQQILCLQNMEGTERWLSVNESFQSTK